MKKEEPKKITMYFDLAGVTSDGEVDIVKLTRSKVTVSETVCGENCTFDRKTGEMILVGQQKKMKSVVFAFGARRRIKPF
jgi:hypothetical protein